MSYINNKAFLYSVIISGVFCMNYQKSNVNSCVLDAFTYVKDVRRPWSCRRSLTTNHKVYNNPIGQCFHALTNNLYRPEFQRCNYFTHDPGEPYRKPDYDSIYNQPRPGYSL